MDVQSARCEYGGPEGRSQELEVDSQSDSSSAHGMGADAGSGRRVQDSTLRSIHRQCNTEQHCRVVESMNGSCKGDSRYRDPIDAEQECHGSCASENDSSYVPLQEAWPERNSRAADGDWGAGDNAVVVAAKEGLGLGRLTDMITQKLLQHDSKSRRV